ncbi:MAG: hypothetical protein FWD73_02840 [Polyangiaceae bacterium]|nr:hypothetical protein [Polyangiaceae bacterium]
MANSRFVLAADPDSLDTEAASADARPIDESAPLPPGHPALPTGEPLPADQSQNDGTRNESSSQDIGLEALEDRVEEDSAILPGLVEVHVVDPAGEPLRNIEVTLHINHHAVAKGDSHSNVIVSTNEDGLAKFGGLETGTGISYRAMVLKDDATFFTSAFMLTPKNGARVLLHVYPVVKDIEETLLVTQSMIYTEIRDDRTIVDQGFTIYNFGRTAWVPNEVLLSLPSEYTAFSNSQDTPPNIRMDAVPQKGIRITGTFSPGKHIIEFRWQLPYRGEREVRFNVGMFPHLAAARVIAPAARSMDLEVRGFPPSQSVTDGTGQRALVTGQQFRRQDPPVASVAIALTGLPTDGPGRSIATVLAAGGVALGILLGTRRSSPRDSKAQTARLLEEMEDLEKAYAKGDVGPKTYELARRKLVDDIARTIHDDSA